MKPHKEKINKIYEISENIIAKNIEGQFMIVPLISGVGNLDDEMFQLNLTGSAVWEMLDGNTRLIDIILHLSKEYEAAPETLKKDVVDLVEQLVEKDFVFEVK